MKNQTATPEDTIIIGNLTFAKQTKPTIRGGPRCILSTNKSGRAELRFNAAQLESMPGFKEWAAVEIFIATGYKSAIALFPVADGVKLHPEKSGSLKITGTSFRLLAAKYRRVSYRVEAVASPRKGWLLSPLTSEPLNT